MSTLVQIAVQWVRRGFALLKRGLLFGHGFLSYAWSLTRRDANYVAERWDGLHDLTDAPKVAIFNHFDRQGRIHDFVDYYLRQIAAAGYVIIFVSNSPRLPPASIERLTRLCGLIVRRPNVGRDFGAYKDGIALIPDLARLDSLLIANDSVYGPFFDLKEVMARMDPDQAEVWGITDSWERRYHLQSFFLVFGKTALASPAFARFWRGLRYVQSKFWIITRYEIGLTRALMAAGLRCKSLYPYRVAATALVEAVKDRKILNQDDIEPVQKRFIRQVFDAINAGIPLNGTHFFWDHLIGAMGCPFLKRELLRDNPMRVPFVQYWEKVIASASAYDTDLITRHLELSLRNRSI